MKSRSRPPQKSRTPSSDALDPIAEAALEIQPLPEAAPDAVTDAAPEPEARPDPEPAPRPMSERRRRRLLEEQRQAEEAALAAQAHVQAQAEAAAETVVRIDMTDAETAAPPARVDAAPAPALRTPRDPAPSGRYAYLIAAVAAALWIGGVASWAAYEYGAGGTELDPLRIAIYALLALAPAGVAILLAHAVRQGAGLAAETRRARDLSQALLAPTALAAQQTGEVLNTLRADIDHAALAAERARDDMRLLREALAGETERLNEAAETAGRTARRLVEQLGVERDRLTTLGGQLEGQATGVLEAVERQSRMVIDASDLAQTQLREAEAALAARAADLAAAAGEAQDAARLASDDLSRQTLRLENAGAGVAEQIQSVEEGLGQQRAALVTAAYALRTDQEDFSAQVESQRAQLTEQLSATRTATTELAQTTQLTTETVKDLVEAATDQFRALVEMSQREADGFDAATKVALDRFEALAADARDTLIEETRRALETLRATAEESRAASAGAAEEARLRAERLGETLFEAAQKADQAAEARIGEARRIVQETTGLVGDAGEQALERLEETLERMHAALARVETAVSDVDARAAELPQQAQARVDAVRAAVEDGLAALSEASRKAAADTEALDAGFQERVRRNYDMLTEAVRLMGVVSGDAPGGRRREPAEEPAPRRRPAAKDEDAGRGFGLRGRLKLAPAEGARPTADEQLGWSDLTAEPADEAPMDLTAPLMPPADVEALADTMVAAIRRMGVDPNALLPRSRIEEAARAWSTGDPSGSRQIVRRVAPAAVRSVSRRVLTDPDLKAEAERYVRGFARELQAFGPESTGVLARLASDGGRAFLLLDAAVGDLA